VTLAAALFFYNFLGGVGQKFNLSQELLQAAALVFNGLVAAAILALVSRRIWKTSAPTVPVSELDEAHVERVPGRLWPVLRLGIALIALAAPLTALLGFSQLPWFLIGNLVDTLVLGALLLLLRSLVHEVTSVLLFEPTRVSAFLRRTLDLDAAMSKRLLFWIELALDILLWAAGMAFLLVIWGGDAESVVAFLAAVMKGIPVGKYTLSELVKKSTRERVR